MLKSASLETRVRLFLSFLSLAALGFILITTSKYGAGVSSDAARNLSAADSLLHGQGFVDMIGTPFVLWPPLYPLLLAGISLVTGWGTFEAGWYLNVLSYVANVWLSGWLLFLIFRRKPLYAALGSLMIALSRFMLRIHANIASEPLFETFLLLFLLAAGAYLAAASAARTRLLWWMGVLAGLASLQRYLGVLLIVVLMVVALRREGLRGFLRAIPPVLVAALPLAAWVLLHNYRVSGTLFGPRALGEMLPLENISLSLTKMLWWFIPRLSWLDWLILRPWIPLVAVILLLVAINRRSDWELWLHELRGPFVWPALFFSVTYFFMLAFTVVTADHLDLTSDRYYVVLLPIVIALLFITVDALVLSHLDLRSGALSYGLTALACLWFIYPAYSLQAYLRQAVVQGEPTNYNIANSADFREMSVVRAAQPILEQDPDALVYSNYLNIVWFIYHHPVQPLPFEDAALPRDQRLLALKQNYPGWPAQGGYVIWFTPNQYHHIVAPDELATLANLELLFQDKTGSIYYVTAAN